MRRCLAVLLLALAGGCAPSAGATRGGPGAGTVARVVDGDTVHVKVAGRDEDVRLLGIDTPETHKPNTPVECFGLEATKAMTRLLPVGTPVDLVRDVEARDRYGRLLAYVYRSRDHLFVNVEMARTGFAAAYTYPPNVAHADEIVAAAGAAREHNLGLWSACGGNHVRSS
jgi:endonuclease YncB( thermonuclease family)